MTLRDNQEKHDLASEFEYIRFNKIWELHIICGIIAATRCEEINIFPEERQIKAGVRRY